MSGAERIADVARRHSQDIRGALRAFDAARRAAGDLPEPSQSPDEHVDHALRERLCAAADYADLPPQILLPAQYAHDSPHRRGGRIG